MTPLGVEYGCKYTLTGPDGTIAVFNDSTDPNFVGILSPESSGLDSPEVREDAQDNTEDDGGIHGNFFYGRRPVILQGTILSPSGGAPSATQRNELVDKLQRASNAMRGDATLKWKPKGATEEVELKLRRQQPVRITKGYVKDFQVPLVSATAAIQGASLSSLSGVIDGSTTTASKTTVPTELKNEAGEFAEAWSPLIALNLANIDSKTVDNAILAGRTSDFLQCFAPTSIPAGTAVKGVEVKISRAGYAGAPSPKDALISLMKVGSPVGSNKAVATSWGAGEETITYGGPEDLWGTTWSSGDVSNSKFGPVISITSGSASGTVKIERVLTIVYLKASYVSATNAGDVDAFPIIKINGTFSGTTKLENKTTGKTLTLEGSSAAASVTIDFKNRTVIDSTGASRYDLVNFANSSWWALSPGANSINVSIGGGAATTYDISWRSAWI